MKTYDLIVIGTGGGMKIALPAAAEGYRVALIEKDAIGGTCLNRGCIPSKLLIQPADLIRVIGNAGRINLEIGEVKVRFPEMMERIAGSVRGMSESLQAALEAAPKIDLFREAARFTSDKVIRAGEEEITAEKIFIAAGSLPKIPPVPGLEGTPYWTSTEALANRVLPEKLVILGGSFIACELGHAYGALGTEVHLIAPDGLLHRLDDDIRREFEEVFAQNQVVHNGAFPERVSYQDHRFLVSARDPGGELFDLEADALLVAVGVAPQTGDLGLEDTGIKVREGGFIAVDGHLRTAVPGVYAFGDCVGNYLFRHSVNFEGEYLFRTVLGGDDSSIDYWPVPYAIFSWPEAAGVGKTERELTAEHTDYAVGRSTYEESNMGMARALDFGFVKLLAATGSGKLLGAHIVGEEASDMIHLLIGYIYRGATVNDLLGMIFIHPALPEIVRDAARDLRERLNK